MPKYILDLEKSLDLQMEITEELAEICKETDCTDCKFESLCHFNIKATTQLLFLK